MDTTGIFRILLADDDPDDRELFTEAAEAHGAKVQSVPNGMQLMSLLRTAEILPDFILLDLNMPEKNGKECLREIRADRRFNDIPVIIYSTSSSKKDVDETFEMGADLYITKPNSFSELKSTVKNMLEMDWATGREAIREQFIYTS